MFDGYISLPLIYLPACYLLFLYAFVSCVFAFLFIVCVVLVPGNPVNFTGVALNATSLQLNWSRPINTNCTVITYKLTYWLVRQGECSPIAVENFDKKRNATGNHSLVIGDLLPDTLYNVIIKAKSDAGVSAGDTWIKTKTNESVPGIPVAIDNTLTSSRSLAFTWQPPTCRNRNGVITKYYCKLVTTETSTLFKEISVSPDVTSATFDGLTACTEYRFKVLAQTSAGNGSFSGAVTVTTDGEGMYTCVLKINNNKQCLYSAIPKIGMVIELYNMKSLRKIYTDIVKNKQKQSNHE